MWITRKYERTLAALSRQFPAVVLTGARQVGKTSLVRRVFPEHAYVSLDLPAAAEQAENSPDRFLGDYPEPLVIDEVQYAPALFRHLKVKIDADKRPGRYVLTGSQNFPLMQDISESLAGRCGVLQMLNLSFGELMTSAPDVSEGAYLTKGGWPELHARSDLDPHFWYAAYLSTYLERDVRNILNVGSLRDFDRFLRAAAARTGQLLSYSDLARDVGIAPNTAKQWISVLQSSGQIILLEPYYRNLGKRLVKSPKLYQCDTGLALFLMGFDSWEAAARSPLVGALWETHVVMQVVKHFTAKGRSVPLWYWRTASGAEVDLLIERGGRFTAIEAKFTERPEGGDLKGFEALESFYGPNSLSNGIIACRSARAYKMTAGIYAVPAKKIDQHLE
ncbi:MAG: ATP-binding protein [Deltaproteobacteria bacterium]|nr:ATP-binding protein [Deltaproteobacteria bacterium]